MLSVIIYDVVYKYWMFLTVLFAGIIIYGSLWPLPDLPLPSNDKVHHIIGYFGLSLPLAIRRPPKTWIWCSVIVSLSAAIELLQPYVNRYGEWQDLAANCAGIGLALALALGALITKWVPKPHTPKS